MAEFALGLDFGAESGRALLVDVATGQEVASAVSPYADGVIDRTLPGTDIRLEPDWALQNPADYIETLKHAVPEALQQGGVRAQDVIGIGVDFTACTILPTRADGTPLCFLDEWKRRPHAWVKLWKRHTIYQQLFAEYHRLVEYFGRGENDAMKRLRALRDATVDSRESNE